MNVLREAVGIDVSKDQLVCCLLGIDAQQGLHLLAEASFPNRENGFPNLLQWVSAKRSTSATLPVLHVMEATGIYYENLAFFLARQHLEVAVLLPMKTKYFAKSLEVKTKTDRVDARILAQIGLERKLLRWQAPSQDMLLIKQLCREYRTNKAHLNQLKNRLHAREHAYCPHPSVIRRLKSNIRRTELDCKEIEVELMELLTHDPALNHRIECMCSIPGINQLTAVCLVAETNGFALIRNAKQLASYAGLDVVHRQSGKSIGKTKISKKGNAFIRQAIYMPALCAANHNPSLKAFYQRVIDGKPSKKVGVTAVARKLLLLCYTLYKNQTHYQPAF